MTMGRRRQAREAAMQALYAIDMSRLNPDEAFARHRRNFPPPKAARDFYYSLVQGVLDERERLDRVIELHSSNWKVNRMACVDRNVLRMAVYEMLFCPDIPLKVSINEAVDIGKKFGTEESGAFINGILDAIRKAMEQNRLPEAGTFRKSAPEPGSRQQNDSGG